MKRLVRGHFFYIPTDKSSHDKSVYFYYFTRTTKYLLVLQKICGLVMRNVYCLLASRTKL